MKKMIILTLPLMVFLMPWVYADSPVQDSPNCVYELYEGTTQTVITGGQTTNAKRTFLLNKVTGDVWVFRGEDSKWDFTNRDKLPEKS